MNGFAPRPVRTHRKRPISRRRERYQIDPAYREKRRAENKAYYWARREERCVKQNIYRKSNEARLAWERDYVRKNRRRINARRRARYWAHREQILAKSPRQADRCQGHC